MSSPRPPGEHQRLKMPPPAFEKGPSPVQSARRGYLPQFSGWFFPDSGGSSIESLRRAQYVSLDPDAGYKSMEDCGPRAMEYRRNSVRRCSSFQESWDGDSTASLERTRTYKPRRAFREVRRHGGPMSLESQNLMSMQFHFLRSMKGGHDEDPEWREGISTAVATAIMVGILAGPGLLVLPVSLVEAGFVGFALFAFFTAVCAYNASRIGICWEILLDESAPEFRCHTGCTATIRNPYPTIAEKAGEVHTEGSGRILKFLITASLLITLYGIGCVFLIMLGDRFAYLTGWYSSCTWMIFACALTTPLTWFGTPKDAQPLGILSCATSVAFVILIIIGLSMKHTDDRPFVEDCFNSARFNQTTPNFPAPSLSGYLAAFGAMFFCCAGISAFPSVQADMADKRMFKWSAVMSYMVLSLLAVPLITVGYLTLGDCLQADVMLNLGRGWVRIMAELALTIHIVATLPIMINAPNQYLEGAMNVPLYLNWRRVLFRTTVMCFMLFVAEGVPDLGKVLGVVGGTTIALLTFILPPLLYALLATRSQTRFFGNFEALLCFSIMVLFAFGAIFATWEAARALYALHLRKPCYV